MVQFIIAMQARPLSMTHAGQLKLPSNGHLGGLEERTVLQLGYCLGKTRDSDIPTLPYTQN